MNKRLWCSILIFLLLAPLGALAEELLVSDSAPKIVSDDEAGHWLYESASLRVEINRKTMDGPLIWYEADVITSAESPLHGYLSAETNSHKHLKKPETLAQEQRLVFAMTDDFFAARVGKADKKLGVIIREGNLLYDKVYPANTKRFPPLDAMALFPDGSMGVYAAREHKGEEYLAMGATDVFSFGPVMLRDGEIEPSLVKNNAHLEPRATIGWIAPNHFFCIIAEGRHKGSKGCGLDPIARRMQEVGVVNAINMDGGQTAVLVFLGRQINQTGSFDGHVRVRSVNGLIGVRDADWAGVE